jgi:hypothetical protein
MGRVCTNGFGHCINWQRMLDRSKAIALILENVTLDDGCIVGAGAVVAKSFPAGSVVAGVPARVLN